MRLSGQLAQQGPKAHPLITPPPPPLTTTTPRRFSYPVVPKGAARIRTQISAAHSEADIDLALKSFAEVGREKGVIPK